MGIAITDRAIHVFSCINDPGQPAVALIEGLPMIFRAATPMAARRAADQWRLDAIRNDKLLSKGKKAEFLGEGAA